MNDQMLNGRVADATDAVVTSSTLGCWEDHFDLREFRLIQNCQEYAQGDPAGLPGHQLMLIVAKLIDLLSARSGGEEEGD